MSLLRLDVHGRRCQAKYEKYTMFARNIVDSLPPDKVPQVGGRMPVPVEFTGVGLQHVFYLI